MTPHPPQRLVAQCISPAFLPYRNDGSGSAGGLLFVLLRFQGPLRSRARACPLPPHSLATTARAAVALALLQRGASYPSSGPGPVCHLSTPPVPSAPPSGPLVLPHPRHPLGTAAASAAMCRSAFPGPPFLPDSARPRPSIGSGHFPPVLKIISDFANESNSKIKFRNEAVEAFLERFICMFFSALQNHIVVSPTMEPERRETSTAPLPGGGFDQQNPPNPTFSLDFFPFLIPPYFRWSSRRFRCLEPVQVPCI